MNDTMRLICPNCDAQYEVPAEVVPVEGRDVQCSNCGKTWFQHHPDHMPEEVEEPVAEVAPPPPAPETAPPPPAPEVAPAPPVPEVAAAEPVDPVPEEAEALAATVPASTGAKRRELDPAVANILRAEAEIEQEARRKRQPEGLESQPDLGLEATEKPTPPPPPPPPLADRKTATPARDAVPTQRVADESVPTRAASSRRGLLPDIDEINSTLRNENTPREAEPDAQPVVGPRGERHRRGGFRNGFLTVIILFALAFLVYFYAPQISQSVPALADPLTQYVAGVDQLRVNLDRWLISVLGSLDNLAVESSN